MNRDCNKYKLTEQEHERIYKILEKDVFENKSPSTSPIAIIVGGQPGSGKSLLIQNGIEEIGEENCVQINGDEYRKYHPKAKEILKNDELDYAFYTDADVREWTQRLFNKAINEKYNLVFEGTMRTQAICDTLKKIKDNNFRVSIKVLSVNSLESYLSTLQRYEIQKNQDGHGRITPSASHREAYNGMLTTLEEIENQGFFDSLEIIKRNGEVIYTNNNNKKEIKSKYKGLNAKEALIKSREEQLPTIEEIKKDLEWLIKSKIKRGEKPYELGEILNILDKKQR